MYVSKLTGFVAHEEPYVNKMYYKYKNETICIINIDKNWNMFGDVLNPFKMPATTFSMEQASCEKLILDATPPWREDVKIRSGLDKYDTAMLLYQTRGANDLNRWWFAWAEEDKFEDYHPLGNTNIRKPMELEDDGEPMPNWEESVGHNDSLDKLVQDLKRNALDKTKEMIFGDFYSEQQE